MTAHVRALGYAIVGTADLDAWQAFAVDVLGLHAAERTEDRLLLRRDDCAYRLDLRRSEVEGIQALGWDVAAMQRWTSSPRGSPMPDMR